MHYLDNAATTAVLPEAAEAALRTMCEGFGNPSSLHRLGLEAARLLEDSRKSVAAALGCLPEETYFTSCGTESTNISLRGAAYLNRHQKGRIITTEIEHAATLNTCKQLAAEGYDVVFLKPDETGHITPAALAEALTEDTFLLSCQLVNNEIGTVQPVAEFGAMLKSKAPRALFHIDAVQGLARVKLTPKKWNCDLMSVSGRMKNHYLDIPVHLQIGVPILGVVRVFAYGGPKFIVGLSSKTTVDMDVAGTSTTVTYNHYSGKVTAPGLSDDELGNASDDTGTFKRFDIMMGVGGGVELFKHLTVKAGYEWGLMNLSKADGMTINRNQFVVSAGLSF